MEFVEFEISAVEGFRQKFWELDQEHQRWCKQLLFPEGFSVTREKKVYTRKISDFYRVNKNAPKDVSADFSRMVNLRGSSLETLYLELGNLSDKLLAQEVADVQDI